MKSITNDIRNNLNDQGLLDSLDEFLESQSETVHQDVTFEEAHERFFELRSILLELIDSGQFDKVTALNRRRAIQSVLQNIVQNRSNVSEFIKFSENLYDHLHIAGLLDPYEEKANYQQKLSQLTKLKRRYTTYLDDFSKVEEVSELIDQKKKELEETITQAEKNKQDLAKFRDEAEKLRGETKSWRDQGQQIVERSRQSDEQIETQKSKINAFFNNVDEYKTTVEDLVSKSKEILKAEDQINALIAEAKEALKLSSGVGISAAFSSQYDNANMSEKYRWWLIGAGSFVLVALLLTIWIVGGWWIEDRDSISSIVGRVVAVGVAISGATFCAKRYVSQKNLAEDYAYKAVLSKSIVAFRDEIQYDDGEDGSKRFSDYLNTVLTEIHKDPLRSRDSREKSTNESLTILEKIESIVKNNN